MLSVDITNKKQNIKMIFKEVIGRELYVYIVCPIKRKIELLYKRWLNYDYGMVMDRQPFTAKDVEEFTKKQNNVK